MIQINPVNNLGSSLGLPVAADRDVSTPFSDVLHQSQSAKPLTEEDARDAARGLVSSAFLLPMLAQVRASAMENDLFHGGQAEDIWRQQLDTLIADEIVKKADFPMVEAIYRDFMPTVEEVDLHG